MSAAFDLLSEARAAGIEVTARGDRLHLAAPAGTLTPDLRARLAANKADVLALVTAPDPRARLLAMIRSEGLPDAILSDDDATAEQLADLDGAGMHAYVQALHATAERQAGRVPPGWDFTAHCAGCGPVYLFAPGHVAACPWCWNRRALKAIPRPRVRCGDCQHFTPDQTNPAAGAGTCPHPQGARSLWPTAERICTAYRQATP